jgi:hypothetical protein
VRRLATAASYLVIKRLWKSWGGDLCLDVRKELLKASEILKDAHEEVWRLKQRRIQDTGMRSVLTLVL